MTSRILFFDYSDSTSALQSLDVPQQPVSSRLVCTKCFRFEDSLRTSCPRTILVLREGEMKRLLAKLLYHEKLVSQQSDDRNCAFDVGVEVGFE